MMRDPRCDAFQILIEERQKYNLTQKEVSEMLGKPQLYVSKYETGE
jgi:transcriptional regulator with XRE-family HTH domain